MKCPNCGYNNNVLSLCGCTWNEMLKAINVKIKKHRKFLEKVGRPVIVNEQR